MPSSSGSHWRGPLLGSKRAAGGLFADCTIGLTNQRSGWYFWDDFLETRPATHWTQTDITAGTVAYGNSGASGTVTLSHGTVNQGPSIQLNGTVFTGNVYSGGDPGTNDRISVAAVEFRATRATTGTSGDVFMGFATTGAVHPVLATGIPNVAGVADGAGFLWAGSNVGTLTLWDAGVLRTLTSPPTQPQWVTNTFNRFGVRIETTNEPRDNVFWYKDGVKIHSHRMTTATQFSTAMVPTIGFVNESGAAASIIVDYMGCGIWERAL